MSQVLSWCRLEYSFFYTGRRLAVEKDDSSKSDSSLEFWIFNMRLGLWVLEFGFLDLGLGRVLGTSSCRFAKIGELNLV